MYSGQEEEAGEDKQEGEDFDPELLLVEVEAAGERRKNDVERSFRRGDI